MQLAGRELEQTVGHRDHGALWIGLAKPARHRELVVDPGACLHGVHKVVDVVAVRLERSQLEGRLLALGLLPRRAPHLCTVQEQVQDPADLFGLHLAIVGAGVGVEAASVPLQRPPVLVAAVALEEHGGRLVGVGGVEDDGLGLVLSIALCACLLLPGPGPGGFG